MISGSSTPKQHEDFITKFKERFFDVVEQNPKLGQLIENLEAALEDNIPEGQQADVAAVAFNYAVDVAMQQAVPVFLSLLVEQNMDFVKELATILEVDWIENHKLMRKQDLN